MAPTPTAVTRPPCTFFAKGNCRDGANCRFAHTASPAERPKKAAPPPTVVSLPAELPVVSIDVECVATGVQHHDRSVAQISLVDSACTPRLNLCAPRLARPSQRTAASYLHAHAHTHTTLAHLRTNAPAHLCTMPSACVPGVAAASPVRPSSPLGRYVRPENPVVSYITPLTGVSAKLLNEHGVPLAEAMATLRSQLPKNAVLVGQNIAKDVEWLGLVEGQDFKQMVDLAALLRCWNPKFGSYTYAAQDHYASVWLGACRTEADAHDAVADAVHAHARASLNPRDVPRPASALRLGSA